MKSRVWRSPLPYLALALCNFIWGANFVVAKLTLREFPVFGLAFIRFTLASIFLIPFLLAERKKIRIKAEHLPKLLLTGLCLATFNIALFYEGLNLTTAINASALNLLIPIISVVGAWIFLKEKIFRINLLGITLGLLGSLVVIGIPLIFVGDFFGKALLGNILIILSNISFVIGAILSKKMLKYYSSLFIIADVFFIGMITFALPAVNEYLQNPGWVSQISILGVMGVLYITLLSSVSAYFLFQWALNRMDVVQANLFQYFEPAVAATLAIPFLGERISFSYIIGTCLVVLGVYWGTLGKPEHHHLHHRHHRI